MFSINPTFPSAERVQVGLLYNFKWDIKFVPAASTPVASAGITTEADHLSRCKQFHYKQAHGNKNSDFCTDLKLDCS